MDVTDIPEEAHDGAESPPDLTELESPAALLKDGPTRERLLDVITGPRTATVMSSEFSRDFQPGTRIRKRCVPTKAR
jgi:hypothetical protein